MEVNKVRLDKVEIGGLQITNLSKVINKLYDKGIISVRKEGEYINLKRSKEETIDMLWGNIHGSISVQLSVREDIGNLRGWTLVEYNNYLLYVKKSLFLNWGIKIDIKNAYFKKMEIQKTIQLPRPYVDYYTVFGKMIRLHERCKYGHFDSKNSNTTFYAKKTSSQLKIYDKGSQYHVPVDNRATMVRVEYSLSTPRQIEKNLKKTRIWDISDEDIETFFSDKVDNIKEKYDQFLKDNRRTLKSIVMNHIHDKNMVEEILIDICNRELAIRSTPKEDSIILWDVSLLEEELMGLTTAGKTKKLFSERRIKDNIRLLHKLLEKKYSSLNRHGDELLKEVFNLL